MSSPAVANGIVSVGSDDKNLYAIGANSSFLITVPTTIQVPDAGSPTSRTTTTTALVQRTTQPAPLQYAPVGAIVLVFGIAVLKRP